MTQHILTIQNYLLNSINEAIDLLKSLRQAWNHATNVNQTVKELSCLTDKELSDIGLSRGDIYSVAKRCILMSESLKHGVTTK